MSNSPRMLMCLVLTLALMGAALLLQDLLPGTIVAVTLYKAHLMALGGWGGYWLDRALFPYDRPHEYLIAEAEEEAAEAVASGQLVASRSFGLAMLRRAIVVAACLICVGLGA